MNTNGSTTIYEIDLPNRALHALENANIKTVKEIARAKDEELLRVKSLGRKSLEEIRAAIARHRAEVANQPTPAVDETKPDAVVQWAKDHRNLVMAIMNREVALTFKR